MILKLFSLQPSKTTTQRGSDYFLQYDEAGSLRSITTPRGHIHSFSLQTSFGLYKFQYYSPIHRYPFEIQFNDRGEVIAEIHPQSLAKVIYIYSDEGKLVSKI